MGYKPVRRDLTLYKGQTYSQNIYFKYKATKEPIPLDGITAKAKVRPSNNSNILIAELVCTVYAAEGKVNLSLTDEVTALIPDGIFAWDLKMTDESGNVAYYIKGKFLVDGRVTE